MRILLAEDDHNLGTWLSRALEHAGIQVEWVNDGRLADRALQQHDNYDALVLDLGLPGLDGQAVLQRLRDRDQRLPALILTARDSLDERVRSLNAGADDFLAKPFELAELEARLHALVRRARGNEHQRQACGPGQRQPVQHGVFGARITDLEVLEGERGHRGSFIASGSLLSSSTAGRPTATISSAASAPCS